MPKTKQQFEQIREERKDVILKAALDLFAMKGYDAVNLDEVTKLANCSHGLLYHYYSGKEELYKAVLQNIVFPNVMSLYQGINTHQKAKYVLQDLTDAILKKFKSLDETSIKCAFIVLNIHLKKNLQFIEKDEEGHTKIFNFVRKYIEQGKTEGDFNDSSTSELVICYLSILKGIAFNRLTLGYKNFVCPDTQIIMRMLLQ